MNVSTCCKLLWPLGFQNIHCQQFSNSLRRALWAKATRLNVVTFVKVAVLNPWLFNHTAQKGNGIGQIWKERVVDIWYTCLNNFSSIHSYLQMEIILGGVFTKVRP